MNNSYPLLPSPFFPFYSDSSPNSESDLLSNKRKREQNYAAAPINFDQPAEPSILKKSRKESPPKYELYDLLRENNFYMAQKMLKRTTSFKPNPYNGHSLLIPLTLGDWKDDEFLIIFNHLLRHDVDPFHRDYLGRNFIHWFVECLNFSETTWTEVLSKIAKSGSLFSFDTAYMSPMHHLIQGHERDLSSSIKKIIIYLSFLDENDRESELGRLIEAVFEDDHFEDPAELLEFLKELNDQFPLFKIIDDYSEKNVVLIHLFNSFFANIKLDPLNDFLQLLSFVVTNGAEINQEDFRKETPFQRCLRSSLPIVKKLELLDHLLLLGADPTYEKKLREKPPFFKAYQVLLKHHSSTEISTIITRYFKYDYFNNFQFLTLLSNVFGKDFIWEIEGRKIDLIGVADNDVLTERTLEKECLDFYERLSKASPKELIALDFFGLQNQKSFNSDETELIEDLNNVFLTKKENLFHNVGFLLSKAFSSKKNGPNHFRKKTKDGQTVACMRSFSTPEKDTTHAVGFLFTKKSIYVGNTGYASGPIDGVSKHKFRPKSYKEVVLGMEKDPEAQLFFKTYFPSRFKENPEKNSVFIRQTPQTDGNCCVASFSSLELAVLYKECKLELSHLLKKDKLIEFIKSIKRYHSLERKKIFLARYLTFIEIDNNFEPHYPLLAFIAFKYIKYKDTPYYFLEMIAQFLNVRNQSEVLLFLTQLEKFIPLQDIEPELERLFPIVQLLHTSADLISGVEEKEQKEDGCYLPPIETLPFMHEFDEIYNIVLPPLKLFP